MAELVEVGLGKDKVSLLFLYDNFNLGLRHDQYACKKVVEDTQEK